VIDIAIVMTRQSSWYWNYQDDNSCGISIIN
jgi:hypothetical protein